MGNKLTKKEDSHDSGGYQGVRKAPRIAPDEFKFETQETGDVAPYLRFLPRSQSTDIENDPRAFVDNTIEHRFSAFECCSVAATLVASLSMTTGIALETLTDDSLFQYVSLLLMLLVFVMNIFAVLVITQQYYQVYRLTTSGAVGFDIAKSFYMNQYIVNLRHSAVQSFFFSLGIYVLSVALGAYARMKCDKPIMATSVLVLMSLMSIFLILVTNLQASIFYDKLTAATKFSDPLRKHLAEISARSRGREEGW